jgi:hypothetical protein
MMELLCSIHTAAAGHIYNDFLKDRMHLLIMTIILESHGGTKFPVSPARTSKSRSRRRRSVDDCLGDFS